MRSINVCGVQIAAERRERQGQINMLGTMLRDEDIPARRRRRLDVDVDDRWTKRTGAEGGQLI